MKASRGFARRGSGALLALCGLVLPGWAGGPSLHGAAGNASWIWPDSGSVIVPFKAEIFPKVRVAREADIRALTEASAPGSNGKALLAELLRLSLECAGPATLRFDSTLTTPDLQMDSVVELFREPAQTVGDQYLLEILGPEGIRRSGKASRAALMITEIHVDSAWFEPTMPGGGAWQLPVTVLYAMQDLSQGTLPVYGRVEKRMPYGGDAEAWRKTLAGAAREIAERIQMPAHPRKPAPQLERSPALAAYADGRAPRKDEPIGRWRRQRACIEAKADSLRLAPRG